MHHLQNRLFVILICTTICVESFISIDQVRKSCLSWFSIVSFSGVITWQKSHIYVYILYIYIFIRAEKRHNNHIYPSQPRRTYNSTMRRWSNPPVQLTYIDQLSYLVGRQLVLSYILLRKIFDILKSTYIFYYNHLLEYKISLFISDDNYLHANLYGKKVLAN